MKIKQEIPIFFSSDDNYVPYLCVAVHSLIKNSNENNNYRIIILNTGICEENKQKIMDMQTKNVKFRRIKNEVKRLLFISYLL